MVGRLRHSIRNSRSSWPVSKLCLEVVLLHQQEVQPRYVMARIGLVW